MENFDSDYDTYAGLQILRSMRGAKVSNKVVFVAHSSGKTNLMGKARSDAIDHVATEALNGFT